MTDPDPEIERLAEMAWRAWAKPRVPLLCAWHIYTISADDWRAVARAILADRAAQEQAPPTDTVTAGDVLISHERRLAALERSTSNSPAHPLAAKERERKSRR